MKDVLTAATSVEDPAQRYRTLGQAIEDLRGAPVRKGLSFVEERRGRVTHSVDYSFPELERRTAERAGALQAAGLGKGDRVGLILPGNADFVVSFLGAVRVGIVPVPIYPPMGLGRADTYLNNVRHVIERSGSSAIVTTPQLKPSLDPLESQCASLRSVLTVEQLTAEPGPMRPVPITLDDLAFLQFTSGSTSQPKGVALTHGNLAANIEGIASRFRLSEEDVAVSWLPLYHDMGLIGFILTPLYHRVAVTLLPSTAFLLRPALWLETMHLKRATISVAPNFGFAMCVKRVKATELSGLDLSSWRIAGCGAEPIRPADLEQFAERFGTVGFRREALLPMYGMAESSLAVSIGEPGAGLDCIVADGDKLRERRVVVAPSTPEGATRIVSCGTPLPEHQVAIFDPTDAGGSHPLPEGQVGEIRIAGPSVMKRYWDDPAATASAFTGQYLRTGDAGFIDRGRVMVCGRLKELIIINGRNYYPQDIEAVASSVRSGRNRGVIAFGTRAGLVLDGGGERVILALEISPSEELDACAVRSAVQLGLGVVIDEVIALSPGQLPKTSSGKLQRAKVRELYEAGRLKTEPTRTYPS